MDTIVAILRAGHCKSTHHFFAIDSLWEIQSPRGEQLSNLLLAHYGEYLKGAKEPDNLFKDFENHVMHVADGYWGGAAKAARKWLDRVYQLLNARRWNEAAYAIGVLSHYFTDPFMPLHTAQSPRETAIHRPLEWSVCCSYRDIYESACSNPTLAEFEMPSGTDWIADGIYQGATLAHQYYELLLDDYDMNEARRFPKLALGVDSKRALSQLFLSVVTAWGTALDRIASEVTISIPKFPLSIPTILASVQSPNKKIVQAIESAEHRKEVEKILEEYQKTGKVIHYAALEQRKVHTLRRLKPTLVPPPIEMERIQTKIRSNERGQELIAPSPIPIIKELEVPIVAQIATQVKDVVTPQTPDQPATIQNRLSFHSPIVDAPAIGPKTAARFQAIGCNTIKEFLDSDPEVLAKKLNTSWINRRLIIDWQDQAQLACEIERLSAVGAGLLVAAGVRSVDDLADQESSLLHAHFLKLALEHYGKRLLRDQEPPSLEVIDRWINSARAFSPAPTLSQKSNLRASA